MNSNDNNNNRNLNDETPKQSIFVNCVSPDWFAKSFAEYTQSCADAYSKYLGAVSDAAQSNALDGIDEIADEIEDVKGDIVTILNDYCDNNNINYSKLSSEQYEEVINNCITDAVKDEYITKMVNAGLSQEYAEHLLLDPEKFVSDSGEATLVNEWNFKYQHEYGYNPDDIYAILEELQGDIESAINEQGFDWDNQTIADRDAFISDHVDVDARINQIVDAGISSTDWQDIIYPQLEHISNLYYNDTWESVACYKDTEDVIHTKYDDLVNNAAARILRENSINDNALFPLDNGFAKAKDIIATLIHQGFTELGGVKNGLYGWGTKLKDAAGNLIANANINFSSIAENIKSSIGSALTYAAGCKACVLTSVAERLAVFNDLLSQTFSSAYTSFTQSAQWVRGLISNASIDASSFVNSLSKQLGWDKFEDNSVTTIQETELYEYTGASPLATYSADTLVDGVTVVAKTAVKAVGKILGAVWNVGKKLVGKAIKFVKECVAQPYDLERLKNDAVMAYIDGYCFQASNKVCILDTSSNEQADEVRDEMLKCKGQWLAVETFAGKVLVRIDDCVTYDDAEVYIYYSLQYKPLPVNFLEHQFMNVDEHSLVWGYITWDDANDKLTLDYSGTVTEEQKQKTIAAMQQYLQSIPGRISYFSSDDEEKRLWQGYAYAPLLLAYWLICAVHVDKEINGFDIFPHVWQINDGLPGDFNMITHDDTPSNLDFLKVACGYLAPNNPSNFEDVSYNVGSSVAPYPGFKVVDTIGKGILCQLAMAFIDKKNNPFNYYFFPYSQNDISFPTPMYRIRTDKENQDVGEKFVTAVIAVILVIVVGITILKVAKKIKMKRFLKLNQRVGQIDNQLWSNPNYLKEMTPKQRLKVAKRYYKANRRLGNVANISSGLITAASDVTSKVSETTATTMDSIASIQGSLDAMKRVQDSSTENRSGADSALLLRIQERIG